MNDAKKVTRFSFSITNYKRFRYSGLKSVFIIFFYLAHVARHPVFINMLFFINNITMELNKDLSTHKEIHLFNDSALIYEVDSILDNLKLISFWFEEFLFILYLECMTCLNMQWLHQVH